MAKARTFFCEMTLNPGKTLNPGPRESKSFYFMIIDRTEIECEETRRVVDGKNIRVTLTRVAEIGRHYVGTVHVSLIRKDKAEGGNRLRVRTIVAGEVHYQEYLFGIGNVKEFLTSDLPQFLKLEAEMDPPASVPT